MEYTSEKAMHPGERMPQEVNITAMVHDNGTVIGDLNSMIVRLKYHLLGPEPEKDGGVGKEPGCLGDEIRNQGHVLKRAATELARILEAVGV